MKINRRQFLGYTASAAAFASASWLGYRLILSKCGMNQRGATENRDVMSMDREDNAREAALDDLQYEAVMQQATRAQCIYLFVEGASEEAAFLLNKKSG